MELKYGEHDLNIRYDIIESQILVQGNVPVLDGKNARSLLLTQPAVDVTSIEVMRDRVLIEGNLRVDAVCADANGEVFSFTSCAPFRHRINIEATDKKLRGEAVITIQTLNVRPEGISLALEAALDVEVSLFDELPLRTLTCVDGISDGEFEYTDITVTKKIKIGGGRVRLREITSTEGISAVLYTSGCVCTTGVQLDPSENELTVSGTLTASALCMDSSGRLMQQVRQVAFEEILPASVNAQAPLFAQATIESISLRPASELVSNGAVEALLCIDVFELKSETVSLPTDFFSPEANCDATFRDITVLTGAQPTCFSQTLRETISLPDGMLEVEGPIYAQARPIITLSEAEAEGGVNGVINIEGILITRIIYQSEGGTLYTFEEDVPFAISVQQATSDCPVRINPCIIAVVSPASGTSIDVSYTIEFTVLPLCESTLSIVTGICECQNAAKLLGILIYFAEAGDTLFSIAKRLGVAKSALLAANPDLPAIMKGGERIIAMV